VEYEHELMRTWRALERESHPRQSTVLRIRALADTLLTAPHEYATAFARNTGVALRQLRRSPGFALAAIVTLALGMGATAGVFTVINAVLLRPLPFRAAEEVGLIWVVRPDGERTWLSFPELEELQRRRPGVEDVGGVMDVRMAAIAGGGAEEVQGLAVSHDLFRLLGVPMALGRDFDAADDRTGSAPVVVLSETFWRTRFGGDPRVIGTQLRMNDHDTPAVQTALGPLSPRARAASTRHNVRAGSDRATGTCRADNGGLPFDISG
jgi:hypothetical protein